MSIRFVVEEAFNLRQRGVTLAVGRLETGVVMGPMLLVDERTGEAVTVLGTELVAPARPGLTTLVVKPIDNPTLLKGTVLVSLS